MSNEQNLSIIRTTDEARKRGRNGGYASGKARREKRSMRQTAEILLNLPQKGGKATDIEKLKKNGDVTDANLTNLDQIVIAQINKARKGDARAAEFIRDLIGERPTDKQEVTISGAVDLDLQTADINQILAEVRKLKAKE